MPTKKTARTIFLIFIALFSLYRIGRFYVEKYTINQISSNHSQKDKVQIQKGRPFAILIMGTDVGALGRKTQYPGNTDTMELMTVNPTTRTMTLTAIPRDTLVKINYKNHHQYAKINAAYPIGGAKLAKKQVSELLDVPVKYYALVNMGMLEKVVNAIDGVKVDNSFKFKFDGHNYPKGEQKLNGKQALGYVRMRYNDPNNDYGRQKRGQQVILAAINKFKKSGNLLSASKILEAVTANLRTDLPLDDLPALYRNYYNSTQTLKSDGLHGKDALIDGIAYQIATKDEINRVSKNTRQALGLYPQKVTNSETKLIDLQTTWNGYNKIDFTLPSAHN